MTETDATLKRPRRPGHLALWGGILFSLVFTGVIWWAGQRLASIPHLPDTGPSWYYWKLPEPTVLSRVTAWSLYALHQVSMWALIYAAQKSGKRYTLCLFRLSDLPIRRHVRIRGNANPYSLSWQPYFAQRVAMKAVGV